MNGGPGGNPLSSFGRRQTYRNPVDVFSPPSPSPNDDHLHFSPIIDHRPADNFYSRSSAHVPSGRLSVPVTFSQHRDFGDTHRSGYAPVASGRESQLPWRQSPQPLTIRPLDDLFYDADSPLAPRDYASTPARDPEHFRYRQEASPDLHRSYYRNPVQNNEDRGGPPLTHQSSRVDALRQQNREQIQPVAVRIKQPFANEPRPTHRTSSAPVHTLDVLSTSLYDPSSSYYQNRPAVNHFSDTEDLDDDMSRTTANWKSSFAAMRDRFGQRDEVSGPQPYTDFTTSTSTNFSKSPTNYNTFPRNSIGVSRSTSENNVPIDRLTSSLLQHAVERRRQTETPEFVSGSRISTPVAMAMDFPGNDKLEARRGIGSFWVESVQQQQPVASHATAPFSRMTAAAERLEQLHEPIDGPSGYVSDTSVNRFTPRRFGMDNVALKRSRFDDFQDSAPSRGMPNGSYNSNGGYGNYDTNRQPSEDRIGSMKNFINGREPNFDSLDNAVNDLNQSLVFDNRGCARFPLGDIGATGAARQNVFTGHRFSPPRAVPMTFQHSPSPDSLSGESTISVAFLPHPKPTHNLREQLYGGVDASGNSFLGPYRRMGAPNFPSPTSGSVASRVSALEKQPSTPTPLQLASASVSAPEAPRSPLTPRTTVFRTKNIIHVDMGSNLAPIRNGTRSPDYENNTTTSSSVSPIHTKTFQNGSPRWRDDPTNEALPLSASATSNALSASPNVAPMLTSKSPKPLVFSPLQSPSKPAQTLALSTSIVASVAKLDLHEPPPVAVAVAPKQAVAAVSAHVSASVPPTPTLQRPPRTPQQSRIAGKLAHVAPFHFPTGRPIDDQTNAATLSAAKAIFAGLPGNMAKEEDFERIVRVLRLPFYTKKAVYEACCRAGGLDKTNLPSVPVSAFEAYFSTMARTHHDEAARFVYTLSAAAEGTPLKRDYLIPSDFEAILYDLIETYPGLKFLNETPQFHTRYIEVVIARIFWSIGGPWRNRITPALLRRATLLAAMRELETTDDINKVTDFFCYEHFYVIYCKFWEIDTNHEMVITKDQMRGYGKGSITDSIIERIFSRAVNRLPKHLAGPGGPEGRSPAGGFASSSTPSDSLETIGFEEFVRFILAEEDKKHPSSIEYWFRIMDLDGDGVISMLEMEHFYQDVSARCLQINCDALAFEDVVCMMYDLVSPQRGTSTPKITLSALKKCGLAHRFFNTFVNFFKFLEQETSEGERTSVKTNGDRELTDWEQFCACEYEVLMAQEAGGDDGSDAYDLIVDDDGDGDVLNGDNLIFS